MGNGQAMRYGGAASGDKGLGTKGGSVDFPSFSRIISSRFAVPAQLLERLWMGFATDLPAKVEMNDFTATLSVVMGKDRALLLRFLFRVYDVKNSGYLDKSRMERMLSLVYSHVGSAPSSSASSSSSSRHAQMSKEFAVKAKSLLSSLFQSTSATDVNFISAREFDAYAGPLDVLLTWVQAVLSVFREPPSPRLFAIERRFSSALEAEEMMTRYKQPRETCTQLRQLFYAKCNTGSSAKAELPFETWVDWSSGSGFIAPDLAAVLFRMKMGTYKNVWRFADFAEFCMVFGAGSNSSKARVICTAFLREFLSMNPGLEPPSDVLPPPQETAQGAGVTDKEGASTPPRRPQHREPSATLALFRRQMRRMLYLLAHPSTPASRKAQAAPFSANTSPQRAALEAEMASGAGAGAGRDRSSSIGDGGPSVRPLRSLSLSASRSDLSAIEEQGDGGSAGGGGAIVRTPPRTGSRTLLASDHYYLPVEELEASLPPLPQSIQMAIELIETEGVFKAPVPLEYSPPRDSGWGSGSSASAPPAPPSTLALGSDPVGDASSAAAYPLQQYIDLVASYSSILPAVRDLSMTACCLFGIRPSSPALEKEYVTGILLRRQEEAPQTRSDPYGPLHTEWCVISRAWWESWRLFVGQQRPKLPLRTTPKKLGGPGAAPSPARAPEPPLPTEPGEVDNWSIVRKTGAKQLLQGTMVGHHLEVIPPALYHAVHTWYGGGPRITRRVVRSAAGSTELELFPLCLKICTCDATGKARAVERELLFSKTALVSDVVLELCLFFGADKTKVRLWNYAVSQWRKQSILPSDVDLLEAGLQDGQAVLMEVSLPDGTWPRSQLQAKLEAADEESRGQAGPSSGSSGTGAGAANGIGGDGGKGGSGAVAAPAKRNAGTVGLENLGNTCYLNSSLQVLLHTRPLVEYFLSNEYQKHINSVNKFGQGGRLAKSFGWLASELWHTDKQSLTPKAFFAELSAARPQFAGHQQQDAHDCLTSLLDGLSEDLNLVDTKPYTEQPDSDGRPDAELADIWWQNYSKRDRSIVQALFTGQFKQTTKCLCGHVSIRFETFNDLTLTIPEETHRSLVVHVFLRSVGFGQQCSVTVPRGGTLGDVVDAFLSADFSPALVGADAGAEAGAGAGAGEKLTRQLFVAAEVSASRVVALCSLSRRLESVRDVDHIFFFEVARRPTAPTARQLTLFLSPPHVQLRTSRARADPDDTDEEEEEEEEEDEDEDEDEDGDSSRPRLPSKSLPAGSAGAALVRVVIMQRKVRLQEHAGFEYFRTEPFGLPLLEVLPETGMTHAQVYAAVYARVRSFLLQDVAGSSGAGAAAGVGSFPAVGGAPASAPSSSSSPSSASASASAGAAENTDELLGGSVPPFSFVLRRVSGGSQGGHACSSCHWLARCEGCPLPSSGPAAQATATFLDGETLALDWHRIVWEEVLDTTKAVQVRKHASVAAGSGKTAARSIPLAQCLDTFTREERVDSVCPKCKSDQHMKQRVELWRCPPVLVVLLKRFQYDRTTRRKLNHKIDFPLRGLDLAPYIAASKKSKGKGKGQGKGQGEVSDGQPLYDLYGAVHHVGMMNGGHYIACCSADAAKPTSPSSSSQAAASSASDSDGTTDSGARSPAVSEQLEAAPDAWTIYNDGQVTRLQDSGEVSAASAYLLFFRRRDCAGLGYGELFPEGATFVRPERPHPSQAESTNTAAGSKGKAPGSNGSVGSNGSNGSNGNGGSSFAGRMGERVRNLGSVGRRVRIFTSDANAARGSDSDDEAEVASASASASASGSPASDRRSASPSLRQECSVQ